MFVYDAINLAFHAFVEHVYLGLSQNVYNTSEKFKHFISYLRQECVTNKRDAVNMLHN